MNNNNNEPNNSGKLGKYMMMLAWLFLLLICFLFFKMYELNNSGIYNTKAYLSNNHELALAIPLSSGNRYEVLGEINNTKVHFLIDSGATQIAIPAKIAKMASLNQGMPIRNITAGGETTAYLTTIDKLTIGNDNDPNKNILLTNVLASINPAMVDDVILLGMGALKQLNFEQTNQKLILKYDFKVNH